MWGLEVYSYFYKWDLLTAVQNIISPTPSRVQFLSEPLRVVNINICTELVLGTTEKTVWFMRGIQFLNKQLLDHIHVLRLDVSAIVRLLK